MSILSTIQDPAFLQAADKAIREFCKDVHEVDYIEHGIDNIVALVNKEYVFRFPRNEDAAKRLAFETALLQKAENALNAVIVPHIAKVHTQPLYVVAHYIEGEHLTSQQIQALSEAEQVIVGQKLASFIVQLNQAISSLEVQRLRSESAVDGLREPWDVYFERLFVRERLPNDVLRPVVDEYYTIWKEYVAHEQRTYAIHDDLHPDNLLFLGADLHGIVDFSEATVGSIEEEMRWLYAMGDTVLDAAITQYQQLNGVAVAKDHIRVWVIMQQLASYVKYLAKQETESFPFQRAESYLRKWISNFPL